MSTISPNPPTEDCVPREERLLAACPRCGYLLRGLPAVHACPECGTEVDRRWLIYGGCGRGSALWRRWRLRTILRITFVAYMVVMFACMACGKRSTGFDLLLGLLSNGLLAYFVLRAGRRPQSFVGISAAGMCVVEGARRRCYPWAEVGWARYDVGEQSVVVPCGTSVLRLHRRRYFASSADEADRCVRAINAYPRPAASAMPSTPGTSANERTT